MSVNKWQIYCDTENKWVSGWVHSSEPNPTYCFNNNSHQVNIESPQILDTTQVLEVKIQQEYIATGGQYCCQGYKMVIPANSTEILQVSWPYPITTSVVNVQETDHNDGDVLEAVVNPRTIVGTTTSTTVEGSYSCTVNSTVIENSKVGYECYIHTEHLGRILDINKDTFVITFEHPTSAQYNLGMPFYIELKIIRNYNLGTKVGSSLGSSNIGGKYLEKGTVTNVIYKNNSNIEKTFRFSIEHLF